MLGITPAAELISITVGAPDDAVDVTQVMAANTTSDFDIRIINLGYGTNGTQDYEISPLSYAVGRAWRAGVLVVAGNDGLDASHLTNPYIIAVGSGQARNGHHLVLSDYSSSPRHQADLASVYREFDPSARLSASGNRGRRSKPHRQHRGPRLDD